MPDEIEFLHLRGTHGTSRTRCDGIRKNGFLSGTGRHGCGVYLWAVPNEWKLDPLSSEIMLAACFAQDRKSEYKHDNDDTVCVIIGSLRINMSQYLDLKNLEMAKKFEAFILKYQNELNMEKTTAGLLTKISRICDLFVKFIEKVENRDIVVIHTETEIPKSYKELRHIDQAYHYWVGMMRSHCYVVRKSELITIDETLNIGDVYEYYQRQTKQ